MKTLYFVCLLAIASSQAFVVEPEDEMIATFKGKRALLTPEQEEFLMELLEADDAMIAAATSRGIVDDILQAISGVNGGSIRVNILGSGTQPQPQTPLLELQVQQNAPSSPSIPQRSLENSTAGAPGPQTPQSPNPSNANTTTAIGGNNNHLFQTISSVIVNSNRRNVTGIVDDSLRIATPGPIRDFVTGILNVVYCNSVRRLLGRC